MDSEDRCLLINRQIEKANRFMEQAVEMMSLGYYDLAVNRYYYACYHVVQALFLQKGISGHTHSGIITLFSQHFVKTGVVDRRQGSLLARLFQLRQKADYNCSYDISGDEAKSLSEPVREFVDCIIGLVNRNRA